MAVYRVRSNVRMDSNMYLLTGTKNVLIDCGTGFDSANTIRQISAMVDSVDIVLLTHCHADHIGGLPAIVERFHPQVFSGMDAIHISNVSEVTLSEMILDGPQTPVPCGTL